MRQRIAAVLAFVLALSLLAGCGQGPTVPDVPVDPVPSMNEPVEPNTPAPVEPPISTPEPSEPIQTPPAEEPVNTETPPEVTPEPPVTTEEPPAVTEEPTPTPEPVVTPEPTVTPEPVVTPQPSQLPEDAPFVDTVQLSNQVTKNETDAMSSAPAAIPDLLMPEASGTLVKENDRAVIDYSNTGDGYVMVRYTAETSQRLKVQVKGPTTTYSYNLVPGQWDVFPLSDGNGDYKIGVYQNVEGTKYASVLSLSHTVTLADEFAPYLRPNQYVNYSADSTAVRKAAELAGNTEDVLKKVEAVYNYTVTTLTYDKVKASEVKSGYLPDLDQVMKAKTGICFDYAALMTAMLRSQEVPCKLVVGYAGTAYHAWINVWTQEHGWVDGVIFFDGSAWHRMDPTFASSANQSADIMEYIGDGSNYTVKYLY